MKDAKQTYNAIVNRPAPISSYEVCRGESSQGTHICHQRDNCKRFKADGAGNFKAFWMADKCVHDDLKVELEEPARVGW